MAALANQRQECGNSCRVTLDGGMTQLNRKAFGGLFAVLVAMAALLFLPARTLDFWQAWAFLAVFGVCSLSITFI